MSKIIEYFKPVDPFIEYTPKERSYDLFVLYFNVSILSIIGFIIYPIVNVLIFSELTITSIFTNQTSDPIFQLGISVLGRIYAFMNRNKENQVSMDERSALNYKYLIINKFSIII